MHRIYPGSIQQEPVLSLIHGMIKKYLEIQLM